MSPSASVVARPKLPLPKGQVLSRALVGVLLEQSLFLHKPKRIY